MRIKFYKAGIAVNSLSGKAMPDGSHQAVVNPYKDINGTVRNSLEFCVYNWSQTLYNLRHMYVGDTIYASNETIADYDEDTYAINSEDILNTTITKLTNEGTSASVLSLDIRNNESAEISVNSLKFSKTLYYNGSSNSEALIYVIYLDDPVTIQPNETKSVIVKFAFYNPPTV